MLGVETSFNIENHKRIVSQYILEGKKVVILAHSQGAIYANKVYDLLSSDEKDFVGLVYLAPASNVMADGSLNYIRNPIDWTLNILTELNAASTAIELPLPANVP